MLGRRKEEVAARDVRLEQVQLTGRARGRRRFDAKLRGDEPAEILDLRRADPRGKILPGELPETIGQGVGAEVLTHQDVTWIQGEAQFLQPIPFYIRQRHCRDAGEHGFPGVPPLEFHQDGEPALPYQILEAVRVTLRLRQGILLRIDRSSERPPPVLDLQDNQADVSADDDEIRFLCVPRTRKEPAVTDSIVLRQSFQRGEDTPFPGRGIRWNVRGNHPGHRHLRVSANGPASQRRRAAVSGINRPAAKWCLVLTQTPARILAAGPWTAKTNPLAGNRQTASIVTRSASSATNLSAAPIGYRPQRP